MRWEDERYVRVYTRDTVAWLALPWEAKALFLFTLRKADRAGIIDLGKNPARGLAALVGMPPEIVEKMLPLLVDDGCVELVEKAGRTTLVIPRFIEAQESKKSPAQRQHESRIGRRDMLRAGLDPDQRGTVVYFIQSEHGGPIKIGRTDDLAKRLVGLQTSRPDKLVVLAATQGTVDQEKALHRRFAAHQEKGEWFTASEEVMAAVHAIARDGATALAAVLGTAHSVTPRDETEGVPSRIVTGHDSRHVTQGSEAGVGSADEEPADGSDESLTADNVASKPANKLGNASVSRIVTGHDSCGVTPSLAVPSLAVLTTEPGKHPQGCFKLAADDGETSSPSPRPKKPKLSPQGEAYEHWRNEVWPRLSTAPCPSPTKPELVNLTARCREFGLAGVKQAMDRVVATLEAKGRDAEWLTANLTLLSFATTQFPKFLPRGDGTPPKPKIATGVAPAEEFAPGVRKVEL